MESQLYKVSCLRDLASWRRLSYQGAQLIKEVGRTGRVWSESQMKTSGPLRMKPLRVPKAHLHPAPFAHPTPPWHHPWLLAPLSIKEHNYLVSTRNLEIRFSQTPSFQETPV